MVYRGLPWSNGGLYWFSSGKKLEYFLNEVSMVNYMEFYGKLWVFEQSYWNRISDVTYRGNMIRLTEPFGTIRNSLLDFTVFAVV